MRRCAILVLGYVGACSGAAGPPPAGEVSVAKAPAAAKAPAKEPAVSPAKDDAATLGPIVRGRIESIAFRNINKAQGHYTYNVELEVRHQAIDGDVAFDRAQIPEVLTVRVDKVLFDELAEAKQAAIAPQGPQQELSVREWGAYAVGAEVAIPVEFTAPTLARVRK